MTTRKVILTIEYNSDEVDDPLQWDWNDLIQPDEAHKLGSVSCTVDEFEPIISGPWGDGEDDDITFQPFYQESRVGYHITRGSRTETVILNPSSSGGSPDIFVYQAEGIHEPAAILSGNEGEPYCYIPLFAVIYDVMEKK